MKLNELTPGLKEKLAPTDCRLRPDQRATENGEYDLVSMLAALLEPFNVMGIVHAHCLIRGTLAGQWSRLCKTITLDYFLSIDFHEAPSA